jgi:YidC/Oxa1 family membrane protein insertase
VTIWTMWLDVIRGLVDSLSGSMGLGLAVIVTALILRAIVLPVSWSVAYRGCIRQRKMRRLQPELQRIKEQFAGKPDVYFQHMQALYSKNGLSFFDGKSLLGSLVQMPLLLGMFQTLRDIGNGIRFLWVPNLLKPDLTLAIIAGLTTALMMTVNPDLPEQMRMFMLIVPSIIAAVVALKFCSALAIYWATSNCFSAIQTAALHAVVRRRIQSGALRI